MLVLTRKTNEAIQIGPDIEVMVARIADGQVRLSIKAPPDVQITRTELLECKEAEQCSPTSG